MIGFPIESSANDWKFRWTDANLLLMKKMRLTFAIIFCPQNVSIFPILRPGTMCLVSQSNGLLQVENFPLKAIEEIEAVFMERRRV